MRTSMTRLFDVLRIAAFVALISLCLTGQTKKHEFSKREKHSMRIRLWLIS